MKLTQEEQAMLDGKQGKAAQKSMEILTALGDIFGAKRLVPIKSVQVAGVSYANLGEAGLEYLDKMAEDGKVRVFTTLNPAGMDLENREALGIDEEFAKNQARVIDAFKKMGIVTTCTCTPYFIGNLPHYGEHIAWAESSAVCFANSVLGAKTNREGGPSALAAAIAGRTPEFGFHLNENRQAQVKVVVEPEVKGTEAFGALGYAIGEKAKKTIPLIIGIKQAAIEELKSFCASLATYGGHALFHMEGITPNRTTIPVDTITITQKDLDDAKAFMNDDSDVDFVALGCPHASLSEIEKIAELLKGKTVKKEMWITVARPVKKMADQMSYTKTIEASGAKFAADTCMVVAPIKGRFKCVATDSAKACYYCRGKNKFKVKLRSPEECVRIATEG
jgi:predicted aconitase